MSAASAADDRVQALGPVSFQGELGSYSELAAREYFRDGLDVLPCTTFEDVFDAVAEGRAACALIPIENALAGSVHVNYDLLLERELVIVGELALRIVHHLIALPDVRLGDVRRVYSHPQALAQCRAYLARLPQAEPVAAYDTAGAVKMLKAEGWRDAAAIASEQAAYDHDLSILASGIESDRRNYTRFLILSPREAVPQEPILHGEAKTSIVFALRDIPGALYRALAAFALRDIDLLKIESHPLVGQPWKYLFYLDFAGAPDADSPCRRALDHLREMTIMLRVLGTYQRGHVVEGRVHRRPVPASAG